MTERTRYLICYDIASPKRIYHAREAVKDFAITGQKSFYECLMTPTELRLIRQRLQKIIDPDEDRIHIFQLDPRQTPMFFGKTPPPFSSSFIIV